VKPIDILLKIPYYLNMKYWRKMNRKIAKLPKLTRFWRMTTLRKTHYAMDHHFGELPMSVDIPKTLLKKAWLAKILNEHVFIECYDGSSYGGWKNVVYWPARKLPKN
jgi:hypothetical protein